MEDRFLHELRRDPDPAFEQSLRERLAAQGPAAPPRATAWRPLAAAAAVVVVVGGLFTFPSVRASAQSFLDIFRVRTFTPVAVDPERFRALESESIDLKRLISKNVEVVKQAAPPQEVETAADAARIAGFSVAEPAYVPPGFEPSGARVTGESVVRLTGDVAALREVLGVLGITDVRVPENLDGARIQVHMPKSVRLRFTQAGRELRLVQAPSPDMRLPPALDLEDLGEIALRIAGLPAGEAQRMAASIDWHTTLLVPVPATVRGFRKVTVNGHEALLIEAREGTEDVPGGKHGATAILWSDGAKVYALAGGVDSRQMLEMANSVR